MIIIKKFLNFLLLFQEHNYAANNRDGSAANLNSLTGTGNNTNSSAIEGSSSSAQSSAFTSTSTEANVSTTSPGPNATTGTKTVSKHVNHAQQHVRFGQG